MAAPAWLALFSASAANGRQRLALVALVEIQEEMLWLWQTEPSVWCSTRDRM